ncbi:TlpA disulfide reductase family protein [Winogradskyella maritima]|uniref:TlpA family protein disulfide reductase n=1 Tax=Winogradskyella maritima TaxID=1517766 RepID=A0ABV8AI29_9FLAO|nr:TlpA disulfide reductase family protein [Winogradskyella maritima]
MKYVLLIISMFLFNCNEQKKGEFKTDTIAKSDVENEAVNTQLPEEPLNIAVHDYAGLKPLINKKDDELHVVNFWATWCAPCVKELPYFEQLREEYADQNIDMLLVSLDFPKQYTTRLQPFLEKHNLKSEVVAFDDLDQNTWIPDINENWSGAIPATIIYKGNKRRFYEQSFTYEELKTEIDKFLN